MHSLPFGEMWISGKRAARRTEPHSSNRRSHTAIPHNATPIPPDDDPIPRNDNRFPRNGKESRLQRLSNAAFGTAAVFSNSCKPLSLCRYCENSPFRG